MRKFVKILLALLVVLAGVFLIFRTPDSDPAEMRAKYGTAPSQFVELEEGLTVHLRDEGRKDAPAIILLHGSNSDLLTWNPWVERLSDDYRIIRFDQPGHGLTGSISGEDYSVETYVQTIGQVADRLELESFYLGGNSMGGNHTLAFTIAHPERVKGMILVDASGAPRVQSEKNDKGGNIGFTIARIPGLNQIMKYVTPRSMVEKSLSQSVSNQAVVTPEAVDRYWEMLRFPGNRAATIARFSRDNAPFTAEQVAGLAMPTLVIWGDQDALIPLSSGEWLDKNLPDSKLIVFKNIGHLPMEETPDDSAQAVRDFMENIALSNQANAK